MVPVCDICKEEKGNIQVSPSQMKICEECLDQIDENFLEVFKEEIRKAGGRVGFSSSR